MENYNSELPEFPQGIPLSSDDESISTEVPTELSSQGITELPSERRTAEQRLAAAVVLQVIRDYIAYIDDPDNPLGVDAFLWLTDTTPNAPFKLYCKVLNLNPDGIVDKIERLHEAYVKIKEGQSVSPQLQTVLRQLL